MESWRFSDARLTLCAIVLNIAENFVVSTRSERHDTFALNGGHPVARGSGANILTGWSSVCQGRKADEQQQLNEEAHLGRLSTYHAKYAMLHRDK
jgi:hypothetical protein